MNWQLNILPAEVRNCEATLLICFILQRLYVFAVSAQ